MNDSLGISGFVEWVDGATPLSKIINEYSTTAQILEKTNLKIREELAANVKRTDPVVNHKVGIAFSPRSSVAMRRHLRGSTRASRRLSSMESVENPDKEDGCNNSEKTIKPINAYFDQNQNAGKRFEFFFELGKDCGLANS